MSNIQTPYLGSLAFQSRIVDVGARKSRVFTLIFFLAQATIFPGLHPAWTKNGFHSGVLLVPKNAKVHFGVRYQFKIMQAFQIAHYASFFKVTQMQ